MSVRPVFPKESRSPGARAFTLDSPESAPSVTTAGLAAGGRGGGGAGCVHLARPIMSPEGPAGGGRGGVAEVGCVERGSLLYGLADGDQCRDVCGLQFCLATEPTQRVALPCWEIR